QAGGDRPARRVDVQVDVAPWVVRFEEQQLRDDHVGDIIVDRRAEEDDAVHEQPRVHVVGLLAPTRPLNDVRIRNDRHTIPYSPVTTVFRDSSHWKTRSSVMLRSSSDSRPACCSDEYNLPASAPRLAAISLMRSSTSFSVAIMPSRSASVSITRSRRTCR